MRDGAIEQVGTPSEIFEMPKSKFVAELTGVENIFEGIGKPDEKGSVISVDQELNFATYERVQGKTYLSIRSENVIIKKCWENKINEFQGQIVKMLEKGFFFRFDIDIGINIVSLVPASEVSVLNLKVGDKVMLEIDPEDVHSFAYNDKSLA